MSLNYFNQFTLKHSMFCNILITFYLLNIPLKKNLKTWNVLRVIKCFVQYSIQRFSIQCGFA